MDQDLLFKSCIEHFQHHNTHTDEEATGAKASALLEIKHEELKNDQDMNSLTAPISFSISPEAKEKLASIKNECYVISIVGSGGSGKSTLANLFISIFPYVSEGKLESEVFDYILPFKIGGGNLSTTSGIDFYIFEKENKSYIFLDVEGYDSSETTNRSWIFCNLLTTALCVSHVHLYNYKDHLSDSLLRYFSDITKLKTSCFLDSFRPDIFFLKRDEVISTGAGKGIKLKQTIMEKSETKNPVDEIYEKAKSQFNYLEKDSILLFPQLDEGLRQLRQEAIIEIDEDKQRKMFFKVLVELIKKVSEKLAQKVSRKYNSGDQVIETLEKILALNSKQFPYKENHCDIDILNNVRICSNIGRIQTNLLKIHDEYKTNWAHELCRLFVTNDKDALSDEIVSLSIDKFLQGQDLIGMTEIVSYYPKLKYLTKEIKDFILEVNTYTIKSTDAFNLRKYYVQEYSCLLDMRKKIRGLFEKIAKDITDIQKAINDVKSGYWKKIVGFVTALSGGAGIAAAVEAIFLRVAAAATGLGALVLVIGFLQATRGLSKAKEKLKEEEIGNKKMQEMLDNMISMIEPRVKRIKEIEALDFDHIKESLSSLIDRKEKGEYVQNGDEIIKSLNEIENRYKLLFS